MFDLPLEDRLLEASRARLHRAQSPAGFETLFFRPPGTLRQLLDEHAGKRKAIVFLAHADTLLNLDRDGYVIFREYGLV
jgi:hypothetical protein